MWDPEGEDKGVWRRQFSSARLVWEGNLFVCPTFQLLGIFLHITAKIFTGIEERELVLRSIVLIFVQSPLFLPR